MKVLTVCLGNICRSPLAQALVERHAAAAGRDWTVGSAGTGDYHVGAPPDPRSVAVGAAHGLDLSHQRARQLTARDLFDHDHVLVMDAQNYAAARGLVRDPALRRKVELIMNFADPGRNQAVPDPYWDDDGFELVYRMLDRAAAGFVAGH